MKERPWAAKAAGVAGSNGMAEAMRLQRHPETNSIKISKMAMLVPRPDQIIGTSASPMLFRGAAGLWVTLARMECISAQEYSNSCPHFKQT